VSFVEFVSRIDDGRPFRINTETHPSFSPPQDRERLWRYFNMEKYVSMLAVDALWFSRADTLGDPFEGSLTEENLRLRPALYKEIPPDQVLAIERTRMLMTRHTYVSCWYRSAVESAAMWSLYAERAGIAIVSDYGRIRSAIGEIPAVTADTKSIYAGKVDYVSYQDFFIPENNLFAPFMHKRHSYEHEHEVRFVVTELPTVSDPSATEGRRAELEASSPTGVGVPARLSDLVAEVRVSPSAPGWLLEAVAAVTQRFGLDVAVRQSDLAGSPVY
jgi:hypothetical protein